MDKLEALDRLDDAQSQLLQVHAWLERQQVSPWPPDFPIYGQQWQPWCNDKLGYGNLTLGGYGCVVCSAAMIVSDVSGASIIPRDVNQRMKAVGGFVKGTGLFYFSKLTEAFPSVKYDGIVGCIDIPAPVERINEWLAAGNYVIVRVDFEPRRSGIQSHYLPLFAGSSDTFYYGVDPWIGSPVRLPPAYSERAEWDAARAIYKCVFYSKA